MRMVGSERGVGSQEVWCEVEDFDEWCVRIFLMYYFH